MANKFVTFLEQIGKDIEKGLETAVNFMTKFQPLIDVGLNVIPGGITAVPIFNATVAAITTVEQKFTAVGQSTAALNVKLANVEQILGQVIEPYLKNAGSQATANQYIQAVYNLLMAIPAPGTTVTQTSATPSPVIVATSSPVTAATPSIVDAPFAGN